MSRPPATSGRPIPTGASTRRPTAGRPGRRSSTSTSGSERTTWSWTRRAPDTLYAATWNRIRRRWSDPVPGGEDGLYKTTDGGKTWTPINSGLPDTSLTGRIGIDLCRTKPTTSTPTSTTTLPAPSPSPGEKDAYGRPLQRGIVGAEVYRSDDAGASWRKVSPAGMERFGGTYGWVFGQIRVDPNSPENHLHHGPGPGQVDRRRQDLSEHLLRRPPRRPPRPVDRSRRQRPPHQHQRRRREHLLRRRQDLAPLLRRHPVGPVLQRHPRQLDPVLGLRLGPGHGHVPRAHPGSQDRPGRRAGRAAQLRLVTAEVGARSGRRGDAHRRRPGGSRTRCIRPRSTAASSAPSTRTASGRARRSSPRPPKASRPTAASGWRRRRSRRTIPGSSTTASSTSSGR